MHRYNRARSRRLLFELPALPFLSIMLGLMSLMALATIGVSVEERHKIRAASAVELVGVPSRFIPVHLRCKKDGLLWLDDHGIWHAISIFGLLTLLDSEVATDALSFAGADRFLEFLRSKADANRQLSFARQQNTLILWVESDGIYTLNIVQTLIDNRKLPLRMGLLPIMENEQLFHVQSD